MRFNPIRLKLWLAALLTAASVGCASTLNTTAKNVARPDRWRVDDGSWFVTVVPRNKARLPDAQRILVALRRGHYEDHTPDPLSSRRVLDSLASGVTVTFSANSPTDYSLGWSYALHNALVDITVSGDVLRLEMAMFFIE